MVRLRRLVLAGAIMSAGACSDDSNPPAAGSYSGEMTGAYTTTFAGEAYFGVMRELGDEGFTLVLGDADPVRVVLQAHGTERTPAGTWELVPANFPEPEGKYRGTVGLVASSALLQFEVRGGTLVIEESTPGHVRGTVELRAERTFPCCDPAPVQVFVTATFDAAPLNP